MSNVIINGDFSVQEPFGTEDVINGGFTWNADNWDLISGFIYNDNNLLYVTPSNLITNGAFTVNADGWTLGDGWEWDEVNHRMNFSPTVIGPITVENGSFTGSIDGWNYGVTTVYNDNNVKGTFDGSQNYQIMISQDLGLEVGHSYKVTFDLIVEKYNDVVDLQFAMDNGGYSFQYGTSYLELHDEYSGQVTFTGQVYATGDFTFSLYAANGVTGYVTIDNVVVEEISIGNLSYVGTLPEDINYDTAFNYSGIGNFLFNFGLDNNWQIDAANDGGSFIGNFPWYSGVADIITITPRPGFEGWVDDFSVLENGSFEQTGELEENQVYDISADIGGTTGSVYLIFGDWNYSNYFPAGSGVVHFISEYHLNDGFKVRAISSSNFDGTIDDISIKKTNWQHGVDWVLNAGVALHIPTGDGGQTELYQAGVLGIGIEYTIQFDITGDAGIVSVYLGDDEHVFDAGEGHCSYTAIATDWGIISFYPSFDFNGSIDNIDVSAVGSSDSPSSSESASESPSASDSPSASESPSASDSPSASESASESPSSSLSPSESDSPSSSLSPSASESSSASPSSSESPSSSLSPSSSNSPSASESWSVSPSASESSSESPSTSESSSESPSISPSSSASPSIPPAGVLTQNILFVSGESYRLVFKMASEEDFQRIQVYQGSQLIFDNISCFTEVYDRIITSEKVYITIFNYEEYISLRELVTVSENITLTIV